MAKGGSYDFADADDLGVPQQTELGSECNLLNSTSRKLHEVEFDYDKVRMKHSNPRTARTCSHSLHLLEFWGSIQAVF